MPNNTEVISCDLFSILSSLNFSVEDITGLTPAKFRKGAFLHAKISASQATRAADISLQLLTDRVSGEMNYVIVIGRHEGLLQSEAIDPNADKQYRENRHYCAIYPSNRCQYQSPEKNLQGNENIYQRAGI
ncbi:hypothetical protein ACLB1E_34380 [Escherichia coli]